MNIFILDTYQDRAAQYLMDRHVVKMCLEYTQLLCTAHHYLDGAQAAKARVGSNIYAPTHTAHPCAVWARESNENYLWLYELLRHTLNEYSRRYNRSHKIYESGLFKALRKPPLNIVYGSRTAFVQCMPAQYRRPSAVTAYRLYYYNEKQRLAQWTPPAAEPYWWKEQEFVRRNMHG